MAYKYPCYIPKTGKFSITIKDFLFLWTMLDMDSKWVPIKNISSVGGGSFVILLVIAIFKEVKNMFG